MKKIYNTLMKMDSQIAALELSIKSAASQLYAIRVNFNAIREEAVKVLACEMFDDKISLRELLDFDELIRVYPCSAIYNACSYSTLIYKVTYKDLEDEFERRGWTLVKMKEQKQKLNASDYSYYELKVTDMIKGAYNKVYGEKKQEKEPSEEEKIEKLNIIFKTWRKFFSTQI